ncbi:MAG: TonB-dependent receptor, partial [Bacteroidota bacterium]
KSGTNRIFVMSDHTTSWSGVRLTQNYDTEFQRFSLGSNIELRQVEGSPNIGHRRSVIGSVWAKEEFVLGPVTLAGYGRYDQYMKKSYTGFGTDVSLKLIDEVSLFAGVSRSRRVPTYQELYWTDSTVTRTTPLEAEKHLQLEAGAGLTLSDGSYARAAYFHRTVEDAIVIIPDLIIPTIFPALQFTSVPKVVTNGVEMKVGIRVWVLYLEGTATYLIQTSGGFDTQLFPRLMAIGGVYYWNKLLDDKLEFKIGFRGRYQSSHIGAEFNPQVLTYVASAGPVLGQASSGDFFLTAHIGDAYIHLMWENLTNVRYFSTPFYPVLDRAFRLGVSWEFLN